MKKRIYAGILAAALFLNMLIPLNGYGAYDTFPEVEFTDGTTQEDVPEQAFPNDLGTFEMEQIMDEQPDEDASLSEDVIGFFEEETELLPETEIDTEIDTEIPPQVQIEEVPLFSTTGPSIEELKALDDETAGAAVEYTNPFTPRMRLFANNTGRSWSFDVYYVNQEEDYHVTKSDDFNLKYQYEFHTDTDLNPNAVSIRIPKTLLTDRYKRAVTPWEIGVPQGTPDAFTTVSNSPFNYYMDGSDLIFFNYRQIPSGTNAAVQVLYKNLKVLDIPDNTAWELRPGISVSVPSAEKPDFSETETLETTPLTGFIDTKAELLNTSNMTMNEPGLSYTPGLYSKKHVEKYIGRLPEIYDQNFSDYAYVLWKVKITGTTTQAWEMYLKDTTQYIDNDFVDEGAIVGVNVRILNGGGYILEERPANLITSGDYAGYYKTADYLEDYNGSRDIRLEYYIVTAYPKEYVRENITRFQNTVECILHPADGIDEDICRTVTADWTWVDYQWIYSGNVIGVDKQITNFRANGLPQTNYYGWLDTYQRAAAVEEDLGNFKFRVKGTANIYGYTHDIIGSTMGEYINSSYCEIATADDVLYAYPLTGSSTGSKIMLTDADYYFSDISILQQDTGYNVFEDCTALPEPVNKTEGIDRGLSIYAMFPGKEQWELVDRVKWNNSGTLSYFFPDEILSRQPWRVKAVHNSVDYRSECTIDLTVKIRHNSPVFQSLMSSDMRFENLSAITGKAFSSQNPEGTYFQNQSTSGMLYREAGLKEATQALYGTIAMRDNGLLRLYALEKHAQAQKYAKAFQDTEHARVNIRYSVSAFEGYEVYSEEALDYLKEELTETPRRKQAVFYDLLPYGVQLDPSKEITAGRITGISEYMLSTPSVWDSGQVSVSVDSDKDIIPNYRNTGRTLVKFHVSYSGEDPSVYYSEYWITGYGISFYAYCDWKDLSAAEKKPNICAYMPETGDLLPIIGTETETACDDGIIVPASHTADYQYFGEDINEDGITNIRNILYCRATAFEDLAVASESGIEKTVRADNDRFGIFDKQTVVGNGDAYTYKIMVTNTSRQPLKHIVVFDRLENAAEDRREEEPSMNFDDVWWTGTFNKVNTELLREAGIKPVIYYHKNRNAAPIPVEKESVENILTEENGWYEQSRWPYDTEQVQAIAVDMSFKEDGTEFVLNNMESISFYISMQAPKNTENAIYSYNNPAFYSITTGITEAEDIHHTVYGNSAKVQLNDRQFLEIQKEFQGEIPPSRKDTAFRFFLTQTTRDGRTTPYASKEFILFRKEEDIWKTQTGIHATDSKGSLYLKAGEKAVFKESAGVSMLDVTEEENPFWEQIVEERVNEDSRNMHFYNEYRPVLYFQKLLSAVPKNMNVSKEEFRFRIKCNERPVKNKEFWYVDKAVLYGALPRKLGSGTSDENGIISIHAGDQIAVFPGKIGDAYEVTELPDSHGDNTNWVGMTTSIEGTLNQDGNTGTFENLYKWKDLYLSKKITNRKPELCTEEFSFKIWELPKEGLKDPLHPEDDGKLLTGNHWELLGPDKKPLETPVTGTLTDDGIVKCSCSGKIIRIEKLEAGKTYLIQEVRIPPNYKAINNGLTQVTMPLYAMSESAEITNDYLLRSLEVSKIVIPKISEKDETINLEGKLFEMSLSVKEGDEFIPKSECPYQVLKNGVLTRCATTDTNGVFSISGTETAVFESLGREDLEYRVVETPDEEYPPIYPPANVPLEGKLQKNTEKLTFINGDADNLVLRKEYTIPPGDSLMENTIATEKLLKDELLYTQFTIEVDNGNGFTPLECDALLIDNETGTLSTVHTDSHSPLILNSKQTAIIQGLSPNLPFKVTETEDYRHRIVKDMKFTNSILAMNQILPKKDGSVTGTTGVDNSAVIANELRSFKLGSRIYKTMTLDSEPVPIGSELVFRVERLSSNGWIPASDVEYLLMNQEETDGLRQITGKDGTIHVFQTAQGIPSIQFNRTVKLNIDEEAVSGDLRIVEVPELSDEQFGVLAGYSSSAYTNIPVEAAPSRPDFSSDKADTFVNSNVTKAVEFEKKLDKGKSDQSFVMQLTPLRESGSLMVSGKNLPYTVYDTETNEKQESSTTNDNGEFTIKAGQYARFQLREGSSWIITEKMPYPYSLTSTSLNDYSYFQIQEDNSAKVYIRPTQLLSGVLTKEMVDFGVYDVVTGEPVNLTNGEVTIPQQILFNGKIYEITAIGDSAFKDRTEIQKVTLSTKITTISPHAFEGCRNMREIEIPGKMYSSIGAYAFKDCCSLESIQLPADVPQIHEYAFSGCTSLSNINLPAKINLIKDRAFENCCSLTGITLPAKVTQLYSSLFLNCRSLKTVELQGNITRIWNGAFNGCSSLDSINLPSTVNEIRAEAFKDCSSLTTFTIPAKVTTIPTYVFSGCTSLTDIAIPDTVKTIDTYAFANCSSLTGIKLPANLSRVSSYLFYGCKKLKDPILPDKITSIGDAAFSQCVSLTSINIPDSVTSIGESSFSGCSNLETIHLPAGIEKIYSHAFTLCNRLSGIYIARNKDSITGAPWGAAYCLIHWLDGVTSEADGKGGQGYPEDENFYYETIAGTTEYRLIGCKNQEIQYAQIPQSVSGYKVTSIGKYAFLNCSELAKVEIPNTVTAICEGAFYRCRSLKDIVIPNSVTILENSIFQGCGSLTEITIPENIIDIPSSLFYECSNLETVHLPDTIKTLNFRSFYYCTSLKQLHLPEGVTFIDERTFENCIGLEQINIPNTVNHIGAGVFSGCRSLTELIFPQSVTQISNEVFCNCINLKTIDISDNVTSIGDMAFSGCKSLTEIKIPDTVTSLGRYSFCDCVSLTSIHLPDSIPAICNNTFQGCTNLESINIPDSVTLIDLNAFQYCTALKNLILPEDITEIRDYVFDGCSSLKKINIPDHVTIIGNYAFNGCRNLEAIELPPDVTAIGASAFKNCSSLRFFTIPVNVTTIEEYAFAGCSMLCEITIPGNVNTIGDFAFDRCNTLTEIILRKPKDSILGAPWNAPNKSLMVRWICSAE